MLRTHLTWIGTGLILAFAGEGCKEMLVDAVGQSAFTNPLLMIAYTAIGYLFSIFYDSNQKKPPQKPTNKNK